MPTRSGLDYHFIGSCKFSVGDSVRWNKEPFYYVVLGVQFHEDEFWVRVNRPGWIHAQRAEAGLWVPETEFRFAF